MVILVAGDFCPRYRVAEIFEHRDYKSVLGDVKDVITDADYSIANLECPITNGEEQPIEKCGPNLQFSEKGIEALKWAGFDCVTLANNHLLDYGKDGVKHTIETCAKFDLDSVGGGMKLKEASRILYKEIDGKTIAIVNCCEHEFSIATEENAGSNPLNPILQYYAIKDARTKADFVLVIVHGGHEYYQLPSPRMQELYRFFIDAGADVVINHHQHCYSGYEEYHKGLIVYGIGNFCFDDVIKREGVWTKGYFIKLFFDEIIRFELIPYEQCSTLPQVRLITNENRKPFDCKISEINKIIGDYGKLNKEFLLFSKKRYPDILISLMPYRLRIFKALATRHFIPSFISKKRTLLLKNYLECEAHYDTFVNYLNSVLKSYE